MEPPQRGAPGAAAGGAEAGPTAKLDVLTLLRLREQMKQQLMECSATAQASEESYPDHIIEEKLIKTTTEDLEREMEEVKVSFQNKTLVLQRIQLMDALRNKMKQNDDDSRLILETMKHIIMLSTAILESQQQAREMEEKLNDIKRKRLLFLQFHCTQNDLLMLHFPNNGIVLKQAGGNKLLQIHTTMKKQKKELASMEVGEMLEKIRNNLQKEKEMTTLIQNIFQNIIIGSRVNWAEDPSLKAIVLQLEKNLSFL
ncbi:centromere protein H-like isoform X1 [Struthio camelus]|uniref:centromere protein H-like isoform X1 n=2 Tax=Struthio camelus TaxID=8801 RepID=UPI003603B2AA